VIDRRRFLLTSLAGALVAPVAVHARAVATIPRLGYLSPLSRDADAPRREPFRQGLEKLGYREGQNLVIEYRWADGRLDRQDTLAAELVRLKVDVIIAAGGHLTVRAARNATATSLQAHISSPTGTT
jgi:ABC-type uncharacterized transport system substrate-binding protein